MGDTGVLIDATPESSGGVEKEDVAIGPHESAPLYSYITPCFQFGLGTLNRSNAPSTICRQTRLPREAATVLPSVGDEDTGQDFRLVRQVPVAKDGPGHHGKPHGTPGLVLTTILSHYPGRRAVAFAPSHRQYANRPGAGQPAILLHGRILGRAA